MIEVGLLFYSKAIDKPLFSFQLVTCKARFLKRMGYTANVIYVPNGEKPYSHIGLTVKEAILAKGHFVLAREEI